MSERRSSHIRIAAIGDLHVRRKFPDELAADLASLHERADVLVIAGDITNNGLVAQASLAAEAFDRVRLPMLAVLGNHDRRCIRPRQFRQVLERVGVRFLEGDHLQLDGFRRVGFAGVAGSGGGWWPDEGPDTLTRRACQRLAVRARWEADRLDRALGDLETEHKVVVTHFAPTMATLGNEPRFKNWLLGNCVLGRVVDRHKVDLMLHGHAHHGDAIGRTLGGTLVRNVAYDVTGGGVIVHDLAISPFRPASPSSSWSHCRQ